MNAPESIIAFQNAKDKPNHADRTADEGRIAALEKFALKSFQNLSKEDLLLAQAITGHGDEWGVWKNPEELCPSKLKAHHRSIDIAGRLRFHLAKTHLLETSPNVIAALVEEGVLVLKRLTLLMRLAPTSSRGRDKRHRLKPSTLANNLYSYWPKIITNAIERKVAQPESPGLFSCLVELDVQKLRKNRYMGVELDRLTTLAERGFWTDLPPKQDIAQTTDPRGAQPKAELQVIPGEFRPISDQYLQEFGPRNLWLIRELGPRLLPMLEDLTTYLGKLEWRKISSKQQLKPVLRKFINGHLNAFPWVDSTGSPLKPNFPLKTGARAKDQFQFPPRTWEDLKSLSASLQSAHLFLTLLATAGRIGEVENLTRSCVTYERDGKNYLRGWTYKLSGNLFGDARSWPAPKILVQALGQQVRLANVWIRLPPRKVTDGLPKELPTHGALWLSLGSARTCDASMPLRQVNPALQTLAIRIGMDPKPDGINLHPHRLRKTIGRLAGIALFNSPTVLKRLFGHKSIEMTLHYILCAKDIQTEAEAVLRELRIMHCAEALEEVRDAIASGTQLPAHSGAAASRLADAVKEHEARLTESGRVWRQGSAYDLAYLLTARGKGWRFVQKNIICAKVPGEAGLCMKNRGEPNTSNCQAGCDNRIVLEIARRDADEILEAYMNICLQALEEEQFDTFHYSMGQLLKELDNFSDIKEKYLADPQMQSLLSTYKELDE
jgi:integrase